MAEPSEETKQTASKMNSKGFGKSLASGFKKVKDVSKKLGNFADDVTTHNILNSSKSTPKQLLGELYKILVKMDEDKKLLREEQESHAHDEEDLKNKRNEELVKAITGRFAKKLPERDEKGRFKKAEEKPAEAPKPEAKVTKAETKVTEKPGKGVEKQVKAETKTVEKQAKAETKSVEKQAKAETKSVQKQAKTESDKATKVAEKEADVAKKTAERESKAVKDKIDKKTEATKKKAEPVKEKPAEAPKKAEPVKEKPAEAPKKAEPVKEKPPEITKTITKGLDATGKAPSKEIFVSSMSSVAQNVSKKLGGKIPPAALLAQWGLETGDGKNLVAPFNYGNIKATKAQKDSGQVGGFKTVEEAYTPKKLEEIKSGKTLEEFVQIIGPDDKVIKRNGSFYTVDGWYGKGQYAAAQAVGKQWAQVKSYFAKYKSPEDFGDAFAKLLSNPRYKESLEKGDISEYAKTVGAAGYHTANVDKYASSVSKTASEYTQILNQSGSKIDQASKDNKDGKKELEKNAQKASSQTNIINNQVNNTEPNAPAQEDERSAVQKKRQGK